MGPPSRRERDVVRDGYPRLPGEWYMTTSPRVVSTRATRARLPIDRTRRPHRSRGVVMAMWRSACRCRLTRYDPAPRRDGHGACVATSRRARRSMRSSPPSFPPDARAWQPSTTYIRTSAVVAVAIVMPLGRGSRLRALTTLCARARRGTTVCRPRAPSRALARPLPVRVPDRRCPVRRAAIVCGRGPRGPRSFHDQPRGRVGGRQHAQPGGEQMSAAARTIRTHRCWRARDYWVSRGRIAHACRSYTDRVYLQTRRVYDRGRPSCRGRRIALAAATHAADLAFGAGQVGQIARARP